MCVLKNQVCWTVGSTQLTMVLGDNFPFLHFFLSLSSHSFLLFFFFRFEHAWLLHVYLLCFILTHSALSLFSLMLLQSSSRFPFLPHLVLPSNFLPCTSHYCLFPTSFKVFSSHLMIYFLVSWSINKHNFKSRFYIFVKHTVTFLNLACFTKYNAF